MSITLNCVKGELWQLSQYSDDYATGYTTGVWFPERAENFSGCHCVQTGSGAHPASYSMRTRGSILEGKATMVW